MTNEAVLRHWQEDPMDFIVSALVGIEKGTVLKMTDPRTAIASSGKGDIPAGIARREHLANSDRVRLAVFRKGIFDMKVVSGNNISVGDQVIISGVNTIVRALTDGTEDHLVLGRALETSTSDETIQVAVNM